jgi:hypothetical protein
VQDAHSYTVPWAGMELVQNYTVAAPRPSE